MQRQGPQRQNHATGLICGEDAGRLAGRDSALNTPRPDLHRPRQPTANHRRGGHKTTRCAYTKRDKEMSHAAHKVGYPSRSTAHLRDATACRGHRRGNHLLMARPRIDRLNRSIPARRPCHQAARLGPYGTTRDENRKIQACPRTAEIPRLPLTDYVELSPSDKPLTWYITQTST